MHGGKHGIPPSFGKKNLENNFFTIFAMREKKCCAPKGYV